MSMALTKTYLYFEYVPTFEQLNSRLWQMRNSCNSTPSYLIVQPSSVQSYNSNIDYLQATYPSCHSFTPPSHRTYRVVIRNLHNSTFYTPKLVLHLPDQNIQFKMYKMPKIKINANFHYFLWTFVHKIITMISTI